MKAQNLIVPDVEGIIFVRKEKQKLVRNGETCLFDRLMAKKRGWRVASPPSFATHEKLLELLALTEAPFIVDDSPGFFFRDRGWDQGNHPRSGAAVLNDPEEFAIFPLLVELAVGEIPRAWVQDLPGFTLAVSGLAMTIEAGALPLV